MKNDVTSTGCPYCGTKDDGTSQEYRCRIRKIPVYGLTLEANSKVDSIRAIEIYCANCHTTLSITPCPDAFHAELPNY